MSTYHDDVKPARDKHAIHLLKTDAVRYFTLTRCGIPKTRPWPYQPGCPCQSCEKERAGE